MLSTHTSGAGSNDRLRVDLESRSPGEAALRVTGELDMVTVPILREELARHRGRGRRVVLDLSGVEFIDSTGLVLLMETAREPPTDGWNLSLRRNISPQVARLFEVTRTEGLFNWVDEA
jgi:anti-anti-sigma factor